MARITRRAQMSSADRSTVKAQIENRRKTRMPDRLAGFCLRALTVRLYRVAAMLPLLIAGAALYALSLPTTRPKQRRRPPKSSVLLEAEWQIAEKRACKARGLRHHGGQVSPTAAAPSR